MIRFVCQRHALSTLRLSFGVVILSRQSRQVPVPKFLQAGPDLGQLGFAQTPQLGGGAATALPFGVRSPLKIILGCCEAGKLGVGWRFRYKATLPRDAHGRALAGGRFYHPRAANQVYPLLHTQQAKVALRRQVVKGGRHDKAPPIVAQGQGQMRAVPGQLDGDRAGRRVAGDVGQRFLYHAVKVDGYHTRQRA
jgi:hypothetical protein